MGAWWTGSVSMPDHVPYRVIITVSALALVASVSLAVGFNEGALVALGALGGYLGKVNGS